MASPLLFRRPPKHSNPSAAAKADGHPAIADDNRYLAFSAAVDQHLLHAVGIGFDIVVEVFGIRLTGAVGVGSALFAVDDDLHVFSLMLRCAD